MGWKDGFEGFWVELEWKVVFEESLVEFVVLMAPFVELLVGFVELMAPFLELLVGFVELFVGFLGWTDPFWGFWGESVGRRAPGTGCVGLRVAFVLHLNDWFERWTKGFFVLGWSLLVAVVILVGVAEMKGSGHLHSARFLVILPSFFLRPPSSLSTFLCG